MILCILLTIRQFYKVANVLCCQLISFKYIFVCAFVCQCVLIHGQLFYSCNCNDIVSSIHLVVKVVLHKIYHI